MNTPSLFRILSDAGALVFALIGICVFTLYSLSCRVYIASGWRRMLRELVYCVFPWLIGSLYTCYRVYELSVLLRHGGIGENLPEMLKYTLNGCYLGLAAALVCAIWRATAYIMENGRP